MGSPISGSRSSVVAQPLAQAKAQLTLRAKAALRRKLRTKDIPTARRISALSYVQVGLLNSLHVPNTRSEREFATPQLLRKILSLLAELATSGVGIGHGPTRLAFA